MLQPQIQGSAYLSRFRRNVWKRLSRLSLCRTQTLDYCPGARQIETTSQPVSGTISQIQSSHVLSIDRNGSHSHAMLAKASTSIALPWPQAPTATHCCEIREITSCERQTVQVGAYAAAPHQTLHFIPPKVTNGHGVGPRWSAFAAATTPPHGPARTHCLPSTKQTLVQTVCRTCTRFNTAEDSTSPVLHRSKNTKHLHSLRKHMTTWPPRSTRSSPHRAGDVWTYVGSYNGEGQDISRQISTACTQAHCLCRYRNTCMPCMHACMHALQPPPPPPAKPARGR